MKDQVICYDETYDPSVLGALAAGNTFDLPTLDAAEHLFVIEKMYLWPSWTVAGLPADVAHLRVLIDGEPWPPAPARFYCRAMARRNMAVPYDDRYVVQTVPLGEISTDPLKDTTLKVTPAQRLSVRVMAGSVAGILATDSALRVIMVGRIADTDEELRNIYGASMYSPQGTFAVGDPVTGKMTPAISKALSLSIDNAKYLSGATGQKVPQVYPWWTYGLNSAVIPAVPEYEWTYRNPAHVANSFEELSFDWTRINDRALLIRHMGAILNAGRGRVWWDQAPLRRPGHKNLYYGWVVDSAYPNLIPAGGVTTGFQGPLDLEQVKPKILAYNNLTELRVAANPGTTILANDLEVQVRGTYIEY